MTAAHPPCARTHTNTRAPTHKHTQTHTFSHVRIHSYARTRTRRHWPFSSPPHFPKKYTQEFAFNGLEFNGFVPPTPHPTDELGKAALFMREDFFWLSHTWSHIDMTCFEGDCATNGKCVNVRVCACARACVYWVCPCAHAHSHAPFAENKSLPLVSSLRWRAHVLSLINLAHAHTHSGVHVRTHTDAIILTFAHAHTHRAHDVPGVLH